MREEIGTNSLLKVAVCKTEDVKDGYRTGLNALRGDDKPKILVPNTRKIGGSLDIDTSTESKYPNENRWDYAVEYDKETFFIEVHPASTSEVTVVLAKLSWLKQWLRTSAPEIDKLRPETKRAYHWVFTGRNTILPNSSQARRLSQNGIKPVKCWDYSQL